MPTEYRMQYCYPRTDPSPIIKASGYAQDEPTTNTKKDLEEKKKYKHVINGAHVNGQTHKIVKEPPLKRGDRSKERNELGNERVRGETVSNGHSVCENSKVREGKNMKNKGTMTNLRTKSQGIPVSHLQSKSEKSKPTNSTQLFHSVQPSKNTQDQDPNKEKRLKKQRGVDTENDCPDHYTEYQLNFKCEYSEEEMALMKKEQSERRQGFGFKDHVKGTVHAMYYMYGTCSTCCNLPRLNLYAHVMEYLYHVFALFVHYTHIYMYM